MKEIALTQGQITIIDDSDYEIVMQHKWHAMYKPHGRCFYAAGYPFGGTIHTRLHNFLMNPPQGLYVDHINRNTLDNRRENLRIVTHAENCMNRKRPNQTGIPGLTKTLYNSYQVRTVGIVPRKILGTVYSIEAGIDLQRKAGCPV